MDKELKQTIGKNLKKFREEKGLTQTDVAMILGSTKSTIATWEQGRAVPDIEMAHRLMLYYGKIMENLFEANENPDQ
jgi:transcriptional regulator with XRE-family HTH domain